MSGYTARMSGGTVHFVLLGNIYRFFARPVSVRRTHVPRGTRRPVCRGGQRVPDGVVGWCRDGGRWEAMMVGRGMGQQ